MTNTMDLEQMISILKRAYMMPHPTAADIFMTAAMMAETIEAVVNGPSDKKKTKSDNGDKPPVITVKRLRELGLEYETVADCAHDLVITKGMSHDAAAKRMAATVQQVKAGLLNYNLRERRSKDKADRNK